MVYCDGGCSDVVLANALKVFFSRLGIHTTAGGYNVLPKLELKVLIRILSMRVGSAVEDQARVSRVVGKCGQRCHGASGVYGITTRDFCFLVYNSLFTVLDCSVAFWLLVSKERCLLHVSVTFCTWLAL